MADSIIRLKHLNLNSTYFNHENTFKQTGYDIDYFKDDFGYVAFDFKGAQILTVKLIHVTSSGVNDVKHSFTRVKHGV